MILDKSDKRNIPENDKCIICKKYITIDDIKNNDWEIVVNKPSKKKQYFHRTCYERRMKNENKKGNR